MKVRYKIYCKQDTDYKLLKLLPFKKYIRLQIKNTDTTYLKKDKIFIK